MNDYDSLLAVFSHLVFVSVLVSVGMMASLEEVLHVPGPGCYFQIVFVLKSFSSLKFVSSIVFHCVIAIIYANSNSFVSFVSLKVLPSCCTAIFLLYKFERVCRTISCDANVKQVTLHTESGHKCKCNV